MVYETASSTQMYEQVIMRVVPDLPVVERRGEGVIRVCLDRDVEVH